MRASSILSLVRSTTIPASLLRLVAVLGLAAGLCGAARADDGRGVLRLDAATGQLMPVPPAEIKRGSIYSHFDEPLGRRVWSVLKSDGTFWHALGEGTTQPAHRFDLRITFSEGQTLLNENAPETARAINATGTIVYFRLGGDGSWRMAPAESFATIYDAETGYRWEWCYSTYIPIVSTQSDRWTASGGVYMPAGGVAVTTPGCGCRP